MPLPDELTRLWLLHCAGGITDDQFACAKREVLGCGADAPAARRTVKGQGDVHPDLLKIEAIKAGSQFTYAGWQKDIQEAERMYMTFGDVGDEIEQMQRKQQISIGDRSHPELRRIDAIKRGTEFTYPGWQEDLQRAERIGYIERGNIKYGYENMKNKQKAFIGDRSDPYLRRIDASKAAGKFTYPGWEHDIQEAEQEYLDWGTADEEWKAMKRKQKQFEGDLDGPGQQKINAVRTEFTYPGWQGELENLNTLFIEFGESGVDMGIDEMRLKQKAFIGDRSDPFLREIDAIKASSGFTYPGWQSDVERAERDFQSGWVMDSRQDMKRMRKMMGRKQRKHERLTADPVIRSLTFQGKPLIMGSALADIGIGAGAQVAVAAPVPKVMPTGVAGGDGYDVFMRFRSTARCVAVPFDATADDLAMIAGLRRRSPGFSARFTMPFGCDGHDESEDSEDEDDGDWGDGDSDEEDWGTYDSDEEDWDDEEGDEEDWETYESDEEDGDGEDSDEDDSDEESAQGHEEYTKETFASRRAAWQRRCDGSATAPEKKKKEEKKKSRHDSCDTQ